MTEIITTTAADMVPVPAGLENLDEPLKVLLQRSVPIATVVDAYDDVDTFIAEIEAKLAPAKAHRQAIYAILDARMRDAAATKLAHPAFEIEIKPGEAITEKRIDVLKALFDLEHEDGSPVIPPVELAKAIWTETPPPVVKTHLTFLRKLAAYGQQVQAILAKGIVESRGPDRLSIKRKAVEPVNVTGSAS